MRTYETRPLAEDLTIAGKTSPTVYVSATGGDSDFVVKTIDVYPTVTNDPHGRLDDMSNSCEVSHSAASFATAL